VLVETTLTYGLLKYLKPTRTNFAEQLLAQSVPAGSIILTPVADGTAQQLVLRSNQPGSPTLVRTTGPTTSAHIVEIEGDTLEVVDQATVFNFLRYGLATGGALNLSGLTRLEEYAKSLPVPPSGILSLTQAGFGAAGIVEFDLNSLKTALQQLRLQPSAVRATLRLTPIRSLNLFDFMTDVAPTETPPTTRVVVLEMSRSQKDLIVDYKDFPGFTKPGVSTLDDLAAAINNARPEQRATVRTDLLGLLAPLNFDVTQSVQRDLGSRALRTGFQVVSELNGTGLVFADSSMQIPGLSALIAPQLVIELTGFTPPSQARFVVSTTRIPYDVLGTGSTDLMLVTITNVGASSGSIAVDLTRGSNVFGLISTDGRPLNAQGNTAMIAAGEHLTFGVTFKPDQVQDFQQRNFQGELQVTDTTGGTRNLVSRIALTGSGLSLPTDPPGAIPTITAPIRPSRLPDHAARVADLNGDGLIDAVDVSQLNAIVAARVPVPMPGTTAFAVADINGDGAINSGDTSVLGDVLVGNLLALPRLRPSQSEVVSENKAAGRATRVALAVRHRR